eukprot:363545-Chlamydomonas_euryale.AAC.8
MKVLAGTQLQLGHIGHRVSLLSAPSATWAVLRGSSAGVRHSGRRASLVLEAPVPPAMNIYGQSLTNLAYNGFGDCFAKLVIRCLLCTVQDALLALHCLRSVACLHRLQCVAGFELHVLLCSLCCMCMRQSSMLWMARWWFHRCRQPLISDHPLTDDHTSTTAAEIRAVFNPCLGEGVRQHAHRLHERV